MLFAVNQSIHPSMRVILEKSIYTSFFGYFKRPLQLSTSVLMGGDILFSSCPSFHPLQNIVCGTYILAFYQQMKKSKHIKNVQTRQHTTNTTAQFD
jgi:hypothetical protein